MSSNNPNRVYLDTETTGLHPEEGDEILSLTIVDANGRLLFDERFKPKHKKEWPEAQAVNHISPDDVEHLTTIDAYMEQICRILDRIADEIVGYNVAFDIGFPEGRRCHHQPRCRNHRHHARIHGCLRKLKYGT